MAVAPASDPWWQGWPQTRPTQIQILTWPQPWLEPSASLRAESANRSRLRRRQLRPSIQSGPSPGDDAPATRELALAAATGYREAGLAAAAIDACYLALGTNPADPGLHLALADLYLDQGWDPAASDKLRLLARLAELTDDVATRERVCLIATERLPDDPDLARICT